MSLAAQLDALRDDLEMTDSDRVQRAAQNVVHLRD